MPIIDLGKLKFHWSGDWSATTNYEQDDVVFHRSQAWISKTDNYNSEPQVGSDWDELAGGLNWRGGYDATIQYFKNDLVTASNNVYIVTSDKPAIATATTDTAHWDVVGSFSGSAVTSNRGDLVYRDIDNVEKPLPVQPLENINKRVSSENIYEYQDMFYGEREGVLQNRYVPSHSADKQEQSDWKGSYHRFDVRLDDNDNPTGFAIWARLAVARKKTKTQHVVTWDSTNNDFVIDGERNKRLWVRNSAYTLNAKGLSMHILRFDMSDSSLAADPGATPAVAAKKLRFSTLVDGNHNSSATYADRSSLSNHAYFVQSGTAPADDFAEEIYQLEDDADNDASSNMWDGWRYGAMFVYKGEPGTAGAYVEVWIQSKSFNHDMLYYFEENNAGAGGTLDVGRRYLGVNPALELHRNNYYRFNVQTVGTTETHPLYLKTAASIGTGDQQTDGVTGNGASAGDVYILPSNDPGKAADSLFYQSSFSATIGGTIAITKRPFAPVIAPAHEIILFEGGINEVNTITSYDVYWDRFVGWDDYRSFVFRWHNIQSEDDTDQTFYMRFFAGPGDGITHNLQSASSTYRYSWQASYNNSHTYGNSTANTYLQIQWDCGSNNREQGYTEIRIDNTANPGTGDNYPTSTWPPVDPSRRSMIASADAYSGTDLSTFVQWHHTGTRDDNYAKDMTGSGFFYGSPSNSNQMLTGVRFYWNSGQFRRGYLTVIGRR